MPTKKRIKNTRAEKSGEKKRRTGAGNVFASTRSIPIPPRTSMSKKRSDLPGPAGSTVKKLWHTKSYLVEFNLSFFSRIHGNEKSRSLTLSDDEARKEPEPFRHPGHSIRSRLPLLSEPAFSSRTRFRARPSSPAKRAPFPERSGCSDRRTLRRKRDRPLPGFSRPAGRRRRDAAFPAIENTDVSGTFRARAFQEAIRSGRRGSPEEVDRWHRTRYKGDIFSPRRGFSCSR